MHLGIEESISDEISYLKEHEVCRLLAPPDQEVVIF